jgi:hypothetical protein
MKRRGSSPIELLIAGATLVISTAGFLLGTYALIVIGLVCGGVSFGILLRASDRPGDQS